MQATCAACKGIDDADYTIIVDKTYPLFLCRACLENAPAWAGWPTWSDDMKAQRERLLAEKKEEDAA